MNNAPLLAVNVGNTRTVVASMRGGVVLARAEFATIYDSEHNRATLLKRLAGAAGLQKSPFAGAALVSVVPVAIEGWRQTIAAAGLEQLWLSGTSSPGLVVAVDEPARVGPDRVANALGLLSTCGFPAIALDLGTATTVEVVDGRGALVGGAIAAGVGTSLRALKAYTARLPLIEPSLPTRAIGSNTEQAMQSGAVFGHAGLVDGLVARIRAELGADAPAIATGGWASLVAPCCRTITKVDRDLTFAGLAFAWEKYRER